jgi:hypothetical protein
MPAVGIASGAVHRTAPDQAIATRHDHISVIWEDRRLRTRTPPRRRRSVVLPHEPLRAGLLGRRRAASARRYGVMMSAISRRNALDAGSIDPRRHGLRLRPHPDAETSLERVRQAVGERFRSVVQPRHRFLHVGGGPTPRPFIVRLAPGSGCSIPGRYSGMQNPCHVFERINEPRRSAAEPPRADRLRARAPDRASGSRRHRRGPSPSLPPGE